MSAGLAASTVTPGNTAPDASLTTPAMPPAAWAHAVPDRTVPNTIAAAKTLMTRMITRPPVRWPQTPGLHSGEVSANRKVMSTAELTFAYNPPRGSASTAPHRGGVNDETCWGAQPAQGPGAADGRRRRGRHRRLVDAVCSRAEPQRGASPGRRHHSDHSQGLTAVRHRQRAYPFPRTPVVWCDLLREDAPGERPAARHSSDAVGPGKPGNGARRAARNWQRRRKPHRGRRPRRHGHKLRSPQDDCREGARPRRRERRLLPADDVSA